MRLRALVALHVILFTDGEIKMVHKKVLILQEYEVEHIIA